MMNNKNNIQKGINKKRVNKTNSKYPNKSPKSSRDLESVKSNKSNNSPPKMSSMAPKQMNPNLLNKS